MKRKVAKVGHLRLSPNEEANFLREEQERRRKLRLQQVREQQRAIALQIRTEVQQRREQELQRLGCELKLNWEQQKREKLQALEQIYRDCLQTVGESHRSAKENEPDWEALAQKADERQRKAARRHREALNELKLRKLREHEEQTRHIHARKQAMLVEKERAAKVATLPPRPPDPIDNVVTKKPPAVKVCDVQGFTVTHYHLPETAVECEVDTNQPDARIMAEEEGRRLEELQRQDELDRDEWLERALLRGKHALKKEHLAQDREHMLQDLERWQQADMHRRWKLVSQMPTQFFQPPYKRQEMREDHQRDLESAFENIYAGERRLKGDLCLRLVPDPLPSMSEDLDVTLEPVTEESKEESQPPRAAVLEEEAQVDHVQDGLAPPEVAAHRQVLNKLLSRIRAQRSQPSRLNECASTTTVESGSLSSDEKERPASPGIPNLDKVPLEDPNTMEQSVSKKSEEVLKHLLAEEESRNREEELEKQKREQIVLLQQLEDQKQNLEMQLQRAQQEASRLRATTAEDSGKSRQPDVDLLHEVCQGVMPCSGEDERAKKIQQHRQRLLEQSQRHKLSVEEARRQLKEYQEVLRMKFSTTASVPSDPDTPVSVSPDQPAHVQRIKSSHIQEDNTVQDHRGTGLLFPSYNPKEGHIAAQTLISSRIPAIPEGVEPPQVHVPMRTAIPIRVLQRDLGTEGLERSPQRAPSYPGLPVTQHSPPSRPLPDHTPLVKPAKPSFDQQRAPQSQPGQEEIGEMPAHPGEQIPRSSPDELQVNRVERLSLVSALLRTMEEANSCQAAAQSRGLPFPASLSGDSLRDLAIRRPVHPPVARPRLGILEMLEHHELSAIQEVETPADGSLATAAEDSVESWTTNRESPHAGREIFDSPYVADNVRFNQTGPETSSSSMLSWRERLQMETTPAPATVMEVQPSDWQGVSHHVAMDDRKSDDESSSERYSLLPVQSRTNPDCFSSTTISTGSFSTAEPDISSAHMAGSQSRDDMAGVSSLSQESSDSTLHDSSIQRIIDKYTRELNYSLGSPVRPPRSDTSHWSEPSPSTLVPRTSIIERLSPSPVVTLDSSALEPEGNNFQPLGMLSFGSNQSHDASALSYLRYPQSSHVSSSLVSDTSRNTHSRLHKPSSGFLPLEPSPDLDSTSSTSSGLWQLARRAEEWESTVSGSAARHLDPNLGVAGTRESRSPPSLPAMQRQGDPTRQESYVPATICSQQPQPSADSETPASNPIAMHLVHTGPASPPILQATVSPFIEPSFAESFQQMHQNETLGPIVDERTFMDASSQSFHPLLAEITASEAEHSTSFRRLYTTDLPHSDSSQDSEETPEHLRAEITQPLMVLGLQDSACSLVQSDSSVPDSIVIAADAEQSPTLGVEMPFCSLIINDGPGPELPPEPVDPKQVKISLVMPTDKLEQEEASTKAPNVLQSLSVQPVWEKILELDTAKGILEESQLTLVSLAETTLQESCGESWEHGTDSFPELQTSKNAQSPTSLRAGENLQMEPLPPQQVVLLDFQSSSSDLQKAFERRRNKLAQRSARRVEELKARRADPQAPRSLSAGGLKLKKVEEGRICTPEQRKIEEAEMYQRTERLYNQLEEVRRNKEMRTRLESHAKNRQRAKEFQQKTLQKLRAKQTLR